MAVFSSDRTEHAEGGLSPRAGGWAAGLLGLVFFLVLLGSLPRLERYHGDERFYTDAALRMAETGDYLTPRYGDGSLRFKKPPFSYWVLCVSHQWLGVSLFSSRLPFLAAGALVIVLTYHIGLWVTRQPGPALLAAGMMASNATLIELSTRSTPDVFQTLFVGLSLLGAARVVFQGRTGFGGYGLTYLGAGLAGLNKGLLALVPLAYAAGYARWKSRLERGGPRGVRPGLWHAGWGTAALLLGLGWFAVAYFRHGGGALAMFFADQTAQTTPGTRGYILINLVSYPVEVVRLMLPWSALGVLAWWVTRRRAAGAESGAGAGEVSFSLGWAVVLWLLFSLGTLHRTRYLLPAFPWLAAVFALGIERAPASADRWIRLIGRVILGVAVVGGVGIALVGLRVQGLLAAAGAGFALAGFVAWGTTRAASTRRVLLGAAVVILLGFALLGGVVRPAFDRSAVPTIVAALEQLTTESRSRIGSLGVPGRVLGQVRLESGARINPQELGTNTPPAEIRAFKVILTRPGFAARLESLGYRVEPIAAEPGDWKAVHLMRLVRTGDLEGSRPADGEDYLIATAR